MYDVGLLRGTEFRRYRATIEEGEMWDHPLRRYAIWLEQCIADKDI